MAHACRNPAPPARAPQGWSRPEGRHCPYLSAITLMKRQECIMQTIRTSVNLRKCDARRLMKGRFEIEYIETLHREDGDQSSIVWCRPALPQDVRASEIPY
jgi:hypothetical protein